MSVTVHRTMYRSSTSLLLRPLQQWPLRDLIHQLIPMQHALKHVERPGGSHEGLDGKNILPKLEVKIEFLAEWLVTFLIPATHVLEVRAPHLS